MVLSLVLGLRPHPPADKGDDLIQPQTHTSQNSYPSAKKDKLYQHCSTLAWAMFCFIFKTFCYENYQKIKEKYCNELSYLSSLSACGSPFHSYPDPFFLYPAADYPEAKPRKTSYQPEYSLSSILAHGQPQMGYRPVEISTPGGSWVRPGEPEAPRHFIP